jgi:hypothetical protein
VAIVAARDGVDDIAPQPNQVAVFSFQIEMNRRYLKTDLNFRILVILVVSAPGLLFILRACPRWCFLRRQVK